MVVWESGIAVVTGGNEKVVLLDVGMVVQYGIFFFLYSVL